MGGQLSIEEVGMLPAGSSAVFRSAHTTALLTHPREGDDQGFTRTERGESRTPPPPNRVGVRGTAPPLLELLRGNNEEIFVAGFFGSEQTLPAPHTHMRGG